MPDGRKSFPLRLASELYEQIRRWAEEDMRSVNGQIEYLLRDAVARRRAGSTPAAPRPSRDEPSASRNDTAPPA